MIKVFRVHLPARTLILAASEAVLSVALFALAGEGRRDAAGPWPVHENGILGLRAAATLSPRRRY